MENKELAQIQLELNDLYLKVDSLIKNKIVESERYMSSEINELASALAKAQGEMTAAGKNQKNPFFKSNYADFEAIINASRPALSKYGLSVVQSPFEQDGNSYLLTILMHSSGQWVKSKARHNPAKSDIQSLSSYNTYLKRMCYASLIGVITSNEDDDGEAVTRDSYKSPGYLPPVDTIIPEQLEELESELEGYTDIAQMVLDGLQIKSLAAMPKSKYIASINRIRSIKNTRSTK